MGRDRGSQRQLGGPQVARKASKMAERASEGTERALEAERKVLKSLRSAPTERFQNQLGDKIRLYKHIKEDGSFDTLSILFDSVAPQHRETIRQYGRIAGYDLIWIYRAL